MKKTFPYFRVDSGDVLQSVEVAYHTWGKLNSRRDNVIVVCHSLTSNSNAAEWWPGLIGAGCPLDTNRYYVICANVLGSCYGTTGPASVNPASGKPYGADFPDVTVRDTVRLHKLLLDRLGIRRVVAAIGGSMGGMQALEWGFYGDFVRSIIPIAVGAQHSAWCIAWSEAQRQAIFADPNWQDGNFDREEPPAAGLSAARMCAMISYRSAQSFQNKFGRYRQVNTDRFEIESYLEYQGQKLVDRFDAGSYVTLTRLMDSHDISADRDDLPTALNRLRQSVLVIGIDSDVLYPLAEQRELACGLPDAHLEVIRSLHGHDAFLIEFDQLASLIGPFLEQVSASMSAKAA